MGGIISYMGNGDKLYLRINIIIHSPHNRLDFLVPKVYIPSLLLDTLQTYN